MPLRKTVLILSLLSVAAFASLSVYVQSDAFAARIRPFVAAPLQQVLGPGAAFGRIKASLLPLYLEVRDIVIPSPSGHGGVSVRRIRVYVNPLPLLYKTISIPSIAVLEPRITAERARDGSLDLTGLIEQIRANVRKMERNGPSAYTVQMRSIAIRNGKVEFVDAASEAAGILSKLQLKVKLNLSAASFSARLASADLSMTAPTIRELKGQLRGNLTYEKDRLILDACEMTAEDARITASGSIGIAAGGSLDLQVASWIGRRSIGRVTDILTGGKRAKGPAIESSVHIRGSFSDPVMKGEVTIASIALRGIQLENASAGFSYRNRLITLDGGPWTITQGSFQMIVQKVSLEASYISGRLDINRAVVTADDLSTSAVGTVGAADGYRLDISASSTAQGRTLSLLSGLNISGPASLRGVLSGPLALPRFVGQVVAGPLSVRGVPFRSAVGEVTFQEQKLSLINADLRQGASRYTFSGSVDLGGPEPVYWATLDADRSDVVSMVALFYKRIPLDLTATGRLMFSGSKSAFAGTAHLDLDAGTAYGESFDRGSLSVELSTTRVSFPRVRLEKKGGAVTGEGWIGFDGTYEAHVASTGQDLSEVDHLRSLSCAGPFVLEIRSSGSFSAPIVQAHAMSDRITYRNNPLGAARIDLSIQEGKLSLSAQTEERTVSASGVWILKPPYPWTFSANVQVHDADLSTWFAGNDLLAKTRVLAEGTVRARGTGIDPGSIEGFAQIRKLGLGYGDLRLENEGAADIRYVAGRVFVHTLTLAGPGTKLAVEGASQVGEDVDFTFTGDANLSLLRVLFREVDHGDGTAVVKLTISEDWANPEIAGELSIRNGLIKIRDIPQKFTALNGTISFTNGKIVTEALSGEIGGGVITVTGNAQLDGSELVDFSTKASIENVTVRFPPGLTANVGGVLYYDGDASTQTLSGEVQIRRARYEKRVEWKSMLVDFSKGFTQKKKADIGWIGETQLGVRFVGKENILFESNLAKIPLDIDMQIQGTVNQPHVLGRIEARKGEVYFRKNVFKILHASADLTDPNRINPALDVRAETRVREYQIQLGVTGTADRAVVTFVSEPPLSDSNILALLTLGRKGEELKGKEANVGVGEATSFATGKFQDILESRARSLTGLDRFQVDPYISKTDTAVPRITVGKELMQDKLFMTYSSNVGATYPEQVFRIEYLLNRNVSLVGDRNEVGNLGADVKFRFEFR